ncbi:MAG: Rab family GTPase [Thermoplasmata archaeon]
MSATPDVVKLKICMAGEAMVGKTSLIRRFVLDEYDDRYTATLGTKITKKRMAMVHPEDGRALDVDLILWDIMGTPTLRDLLKEAYYHGAQAILGVADLTRRDTLGELDSWSRSIREVTGEIPTYVVLNKADLTGEREIDEAAIGDHCHARGWPWSYTSARTGEGVERAFQGIVNLVLARV